MLYRFYVIGYVIGIVFFFNELKILYNFVDTYKTPEFDQM